MVIAFHTWITPELMRRSITAVSFGLLAADDGGGQPSQVKRREPAACDHPPPHGHPPGSNCPLFNPPVKEAVSVQLLPDGHVCHHLVGQLPLHHQLLPFGESVLRLVVVSLHRLPNIRHGSHRPRLLRLEQESRLCLLPVPIACLLHRPRGHHHPFPLPPVGYHPSCGAIRPGNDCIF